MKKLTVLLLAALLCLSACVAREAAPAESAPDTFSVSETAQAGAESDSEAAPADPYAGAVLTPADLTYPESDYVLDVEHFVSRENDEYLKYLISNLNTNVPAKSGVMYGEYAGFGSPEEIGNDGLVNTFISFANSSYAAYWRPELGEHGLYAVPRADIYALLDKYFESYTLDVFAMDLNAEYSESLDAFLFPSFVSVTGWGVDTIESVADNGDGTITVLSHPWNPAEFQGSVAAYATVLRPTGANCYCLSHRITYS